MIWLVGSLFLFVVVLFVVLVRMDKRLGHVVDRIDYLEEEIVLLKSEMEGMVGGGSLDKDFVSDEFDDLINHLYRVNGRMRKD